MFPNFKKKICSQVSYNIQNFRNVHTEKKEHIFKNVRKSLANIFLECMWNLFGSMMNIFLKSQLIFLKYTWEHILKIHYEQF